MIHFLEAAMREKKTIVLAKEIMIEILLEEIHTETGITEGEGEVAVTAGVAAEVGVKSGFVTGIEIEAGRGAEAGHEAEVSNPCTRGLVIVLHFENPSMLLSVLSFIFPICLPLPPKSVSYYDF